MNKIKETREAKGLSCAELSRQSGVPLRTLQDWERGVRVMRDVYQIRKVARAMGVTIESLLGDDPE